MGDTNSCMLLLGVLTPRYPFPRVLPRWNNRRTKLSRTFSLYLRKREFSQGPCWQPCLAPVAHFGSLSFSRAMQLMHRWNYWPPVRGPDKATNNAWKYNRAVFVPVTCNIGMAQNRDKSTPSYSAEAPRAEAAHCFT